jgi:hypothetical protein
MTQPASPQPEPVTVAGEPPWFGSLAEVMQPSPDLLDSIASDFAPHAVGMDADAYWSALHCFVTERLTGEAFEGTVDGDWLRRAAWVSYATAIWCTRSWRLSWMELDAAFASPTTAASVAPLVADLEATVSALAAGGDAVLDRLAHMLRVPAFHGALLGTAYNTGFLIVIGEESPVGNRPGHIKLDSGQVRADSDRFLDVSYRTDLPAWLTAAVARYDRLVADEGDLFRSVVEPAGESVGLAELWTQGFQQGVQAWGESLSGATQEYYDPFFHWSVVYNFGLDAISRAAIVAVATQDPDLAAKALAGNLVYNASWQGLPLGVFDDAVKLPTVLSGR